jgi:tetratricopeptide (TPR) repeat protein
MTGLPERAAETALEDLCDRSVLTADVEARAFSLPPLAAQFIKTRRPEAVAKTGNALCDRAYALVMQYGEGDNFAGFKTLDAEWNLLAAALPRLLQGDNDRLQNVCDQLDRFLDFTGKWDERLWLCAAAEERALSAGDKDNAGWRVYQAGMIYSQRNQASVVLACAERAAAHWADSAQYEKSTAISLRGLGHQLQQDYPAAIAAYREVMEICRADPAESIDVDIVLNDLARAEHANKDYAAAERDYREALRIAKKMKDDEGTAIYTGNLAELALDLEQWAEAEILARESLVLAEKVGRDELIAQDCYCLARALYQRAPAALNEAIGLVRRAVWIASRLRHKNLPEAQALLAQIESALESAQHK